MDKKVAELINKGWEVKFWNQPKRIDGDWDIKTCWKAKYMNTDYECEWLGFDDAESCIRDFINKAEEITANIRK
jgi:hypothetical protein